MKKILMIILPILVILSGIAFAIPSMNQAQVKKGDFMNKKILIAYFSWGGNTKSIAEKIQAQTGGDIFRIETITPYPSNYNETAYGVAKEQHDKGIKPPLKDNGDVSGYDVIFVGTPAWWYTMAPAVMTFLENNKFEGKTIVPFITHGGGGEYTIAADMGKIATGAKVLAPFSVYERGNASTDKDIEVWLNKIKEQI